MARPEMEVQHHDYAHLKRIAEDGGQVQFHNLSDNVHILLPGVAAEQLRRLHGALAKSFKTKEAIHRIRDAPVYRIGRNGSLEYYPPAAEVPPQQHTLWHMLSGPLLDKLGLPQDTPFFIYGGAAADFKPHAENLLKAAEVIRKAGTDALIYRNDLDGKNHVWHVEPQSRKSGKSKRGR